MKKFFIVLISLFLVISCTKKKENSIIGNWKLYIIEQQDSNGVWQQANWMKNGKGMLEYSPSGKVYVHFIPQNYDSNDSIKPYWYVANYQHIKDSNLTIHTRLMHSNPEDVGKSVKRYYKIKNDTLIMNAKEYGLKLKWVK